MQGAQGTAPSAATTSPAAVTAPKIDVNDPLLTPVAPAPHLLNSFREVLSITASRSIDLLLAQQAIERAEGLSRQTLAAALGTINATGTLTHYLVRGKTEDSTTIVPMADSAGTVTSFKVVPVPGQYYPDTPALSANLSASIPIFTPRTWYAIKTAQLSVDSTKLSNADKRRLALAQVARAIVDVYTAERVAEINRVGLHSALERLDLAQRKAKLGDGTRLDVLRAEQDASVARSTLIAGDEALRKNREALGLALGAPDGYGVPPTISLNDLDQSLRSTCSAGGIDQRADILQARNDINIAQRGVMDAQLAFSPTISLGTTVSTTNASLPGQPPVSWIIQGVLSIPLWDGGARYGQLRIAKANAEEAKIRLEAALRNANVETQQAVRAVSVAEQSLTVTQQNRDLAHEAARLSKRAFEAGAGTSFDLIDTGQRERQADLNLAVQEFGVIQAKIAALLAASTCNY
jgi:outer membrane protein TolC